MKILNLGIKIQAFFQIDFILVGKMPIFSQFRKSLYHSDLQ